MTPKNDGANDRSSFDQMFYGCSKLTEISFLNGADLTECYNVYRMFYNCNVLSNNAVADVISTWTFNVNAPFLDKSGDHRHLHKEVGTSFPAGTYDCANGTVQIFNGGQFAGKSGQTGFNS